jgi:hypothetical protein
MGSGGRPPVWRSCEETDQVGIGGHPVVSPGVRDDYGHRPSETRTAVLLAVVVLAMVLWALAIGGAFSN